MADNVGIRDRDGVNVDIAADDLGSNVKIQRIKPAFGADGSATDVSTGNPLPTAPTAPLSSPLAVRLSDGTAAVSTTSGELHIRDASARDGIGAAADGAVVAGAAGSLSAKLRLLTSQLDSVKTAVETLDNVVSGAGINITQLAGTAMAVNSGNVSAGVQRVVLATDQPQLTNALRTGLTPQTTGGLSVSLLLSAATTNGTVAKASAGQVFGWYLYNANAAVRYLKLYNKASAPTVGTDTPVMVIPIPPGSGANVEFTNGIAFATGISYALTTGVANTDTGAVAANEIVVNLLWK